MSGKADYDAGRARVAVGTPASGRRITPQFRSFKGPGCGVGTGHTFTLAASLLKDEGWDIPAGWLRGWERQVMPKADVVRSTARDITRFIQTRHFVTSRQPVLSG